MEDKTGIQSAPDQETAIRVDHVTMKFNMASEIVDSVRDYLTKLFSHKLFYNEFTAVDDVSFEVKKGEVFGIVGSNGSGKSTLLKMIAGVLKPSSGKVYVSGTMAPLIELGAGFNPNLTGRENVYLNGALLGYSKEFLDSQYDEIVAFSELGQFMNMPLKNYSSGMIARIAFAIATSVQPDILLADEVLSVGDYAFQQKCTHRIQEMMDNGTTVLLVSHNIETIENLCGRCLWIEKSKQKMVGSTEEVCPAYMADQEKQAEAQQPAGT